MHFIVKTKSEINKYKINLKKNVMKIGCRSDAPGLKKFGWTTMELQCRPLKQNVYFCAQKRALVLD